MDISKKNALASLDHDLKLNLSMVGLLSRLERPAGGFMTAEERKSVEEKEGESKQVGKMIKILRGKGNNDFDTFLTMLRESGNEVWAGKLEDSALQFAEHHRANGGSTTTSDDFQGQWAAKPVPQRRQSESSASSGETPCYPEQMVVAMDKKMPVLKRKRSPSSASSGQPPAENRTMDDYMKMKMDLVRQDVISMQGQCNPSKAIRLLYANALKRLMRLLEPHLDAVKDAADIYIQLRLHEEEGNEKPCDIYSAGSIGNLFSQMSAKSKWESTHFLEQAVDAIPANAKEREVAEAILSHYSHHLEIHRRATPLKDFLATRRESASDGEGTEGLATKTLIPVELTSSKSLANFTYEDCHRLQILVINEACGIPMEETICSGAVERRSTTVIFHILSQYIDMIMQRSTQLRTVWVLLELDVIEVAIPGVFTFMPSVDCFLTLLRGGKSFTADLLRVTEVLPFQMDSLVDWDIKDYLSDPTFCHKRLQPGPEHTLDTSEKILDDQLQLKKAHDTIRELKMDKDRLKDELKESEQKRDELTHRNELMMKAVLQAADAKSATTNYGALQNTKMLYIPNIDPYSWQSMSIEIYCNFTVVM